MLVLPRADMSAQILKLIFHILFSYLVLNLLIFWFCRSGWLWSRLLSHPSYSPVKGLYLFGGVGTGKTMLMDLFFDQLWVWMNLFSSDFYFLNLMLSCCISCHSFWTFNIGRIWGIFRIYYGSVSLWGFIPLLSSPVVSYQAL